jgi:hypothetical protein
MEIVLTSLRKKSASRPEIINSTAIQIFVETINCSVKLSVTNQECTAGPGLRTGLQNNLFERLV